MLQDFILSACAFARLIIVVPPTGFLIPFLNLFQFFFSICRPVKVPAQNHEKLPLIPYSIERMDGSVSCLVFMYNLTSNSCFWSGSLSKSEITNRLHWPDDHAPQGSSHFHTQKIRITAFCINLFPLTLSGWIIYNTNLMQCSDNFIYFLLVCPVLTSLWFSC